MKIESLNVWGGKMGAKLEDYLSRRRMVDVFCFQEADRLFPHIADGVLGDQYKAVCFHKRVDHNDDFSQAVYVRNVETLSGSGTVLANEPLTGLGLWTDIETRDGPVRIINVHGISRPGDKKDTERRMTQSAKIIDCCREAKRVLVIGDFNLDIETGSVGMFARSGFEDMITRYGIATTRNHLAWEKYPNNPQRHSNYCFVAGLEVRGFEVPGEDTVLVSDHQPLRVEI